MAKRMTNKNVLEIASHFNLCGEVMAIKECHSGHINRTYFLTCKNGNGTRRYTMQMINTNVFKKPDEVMENYRAGLARINSREHYNQYRDSGFFTVVREDNGKDTREEVCDRIARHFGFIE